MIKKRFLYQSLFTIGAVAALTSLTLLLAGGTEAFFYFCWGPFKSLYALGNTLNRASLLLLTGLGISLAFQAGVFNLGGEGQLYIGAVAATAFGLAFPGLPRVWGMTGMIFAGILAGSTLSGTSAILKKQLHLDVLITTFLLSGAVIPLLDHLIISRLADTESYFTASPALPSNYLFSALLPPSNFSMIFIPSLLAAFGLYFLLYRTKPGYELRITGTSREFARYGGLNIDLHFIIPLIFSGGIHGMAGAFFLSGSDGVLIRGATAGWGWNGIAVALIARNHPLGAIGAALVFSWLTEGAAAANLHSPLPLELSPIIQGTVFLFITADFLKRRRR